MGDRTKIISGPVDVYLDGTMLGHAKSGCKLDWVPDVTEVSSHLSRQMPVTAHQGVPFPIVEFDDLEISEVSLVRIFTNAKVSGTTVSFSAVEAHKEILPIGTVRIHPKSAGASTAKDLYIYDALPTPKDFTMVDPGDDARRWVGVLVLKPRWKDTGDMFAWGATTDVTAPDVSTIDPLDAATGVAITANIVVTFSEAMREGDVIDKDNVVLVKESDETEVPVTLSYSGSNYQLTIDPVSDLTVSTDYMVIINKRVRDLAGNEMAAHFYSGFQTAAA